MDLRATLKTLYAERKRIEREIARLEARQEAGLAALGRNPYNRGRKIMLPEERLEVSRRMTAYWAARRASRAT